MYSFAQRDDTRVLDEPFYGCYLSQKPEVAFSHPSYTAILKNMNCEEAFVVANINRLAAEKLIFVKGMAHHLLNDAPTFLLEWKNIILIRHPKKLLASFSKVIEQPKLSDIGIKKAAELFSFLRNNGATPLVIDSDELLKNPRLYLERICNALQIPFSESMLSWEKGGIAADGIWSKHWYTNVHNSEGFAVQKSSDQPMPSELQPVLDAALPYYNQLKNHILKND